MALAWSVVCAATAQAVEPGVPVEVQLPLLLKVLSYDRRLEPPAPDETLIAVIYQRLYPASADCMDEVMAVARRFGLRTVHGVPFRLVAFDLDGQGLEGLARQGFRAVLVAPLRGFDVAQISRLTRERGWLSLVTVPEYVDQGLSVGVDRLGDRPVILINLQAARAEGTAFSSRFLSLRVVKVVEP